MTPDPPYLVALPPAPRPVRMGRTHRVLIGCLGGIGALLLLLALWLASSDLRELTELRKGGVRTVGAVTGRLLVQRSGGKQYRLEYAFQANGKTYRGHDPVDQDRWERAQQGDSVPILYAPVDPELHLLGTEVTPQMLQSKQLFWIVVPGVIVLLFGGFLAASVAEARKATRLLEQGTAVTARITGLERVPGTALYNVCYQFQSPGGTEQSGKARVLEATARHLSGREHLTVLVHPSDLRQSRPLFLIQGAELTSPGP